eukprot:Lithocolla_globosa_v1_NODE_2019_length_2205_cov_6.298140.p2 type:complete len:113 gc:universal NODE_2019_length_2205_cov_6.298140:1243-1581(+)
MMVGLVFQTKSEQTDQSRKTTIIHTMPYIDGVKSGENGADARFDSRCFGEKVGSGDGDVCHSDGRGLAEDKGCPLSFVICWGETDAAKIWQNSVIRHVQEKESISCRFVLQL